MQAPTFPPWLPQNQVAGYYLNSTEDLYSSVVILSIPIFNARTVGVSQNYQDFTYEFLANASSNDGKMRLVIDITANGGGGISQGYSLSLNLFPDPFPFQLYRRSGILVVNAIGTIYGKHVDLYSLRRKQS